MALWAVVAGALVGVFVSSGELSWSAVLLPMALLLVFVLGFVATRRRDERIKTRLGKRARSR